MTQIEDANQKTQIMGEGELANDMADVELGQEKEFQNLTLHKIATLDHLETIRTLFGLKQTFSNGMSSHHVQFAKVAIFSRLWRFVN